MVNLRNQKRTRESREPLYDRALHHVRWAYDMILSFSVVPEELTEAAIWVKEVIEALESLNFYGLNAITKHSSSWLVVYCRHHLADRLIERCTPLAYFDPKV